MKGNLDIAIDAISRLCIQCSTRPRLGALSRCGDCVKAAAETDRHSRIAAEIRLAKKQVAREAVTAKRRA